MKEMKERKIFVVCIIVVVMLSAVSIMLMNRAYLDVIEEQDKQIDDLFDTVEDMQYEYCELFRINNALYRYWTSREPYNISEPYDALCWTTARHVEPILKYIPVIVRINSYGDYYLYWFNSEPEWHPTMEVNFPFGNYTEWQPTTYINVSFGNSSES